MLILDQIIVMFSMNSCLRSLLLQRYIVITMLMLPGIASAQNLPSLLSGRNTNSTFAIVASLLNYHDGRIVINRSIGAIQRGDLNGGRQLLSQATTLLKGWYGIYGKLATACIMAGKEKNSASDRKPGL